MPRALRFLHWLPASDWLARYNKDEATGDGIAAVIVTLLLVPQGLAYALLAGMPPETGLYASIVPLMFPRALDAHQLTFALGEALAHLHLLWFERKVQRIAGADGVLRFVRIGTD